MSLWKKWEREKLERMGVKVEHKSDVKIHDMRPKANVRKQMLIVVGALLGCFLVVYLALVLNAMYGGQWSDLAMIRAMADRMGYRISTLE